MSTRHRGESEWKALIDEYENSDLTIKEFCHRREISYWTFRQWRRRLADEQPEVEIARVDHPLPNEGFLRLTVGAVTIEVGTPVDEAKEKEAEDLEEGVEVIDVSEHQPRRNSSKKGRT